MAHKKKDLQVVIDCFAQVSQLFGTTISLGKTVVLLQAAPHTTKQQPSNSIVGTELKCMDTLKYLGSTTSSDGSLDTEITARIQKASQALGHHRVKVLQQKGIRLTTKLKIYKPLSSLHFCMGAKHGLSTDVTSNNLNNSTDISSLNHEHLNLEVLERAESQSIESMLIKAQLRWTGHVIRMEDYRIPKQLLYGELCEGKKTGRPRLRNKDTLKSNLKLPHV